MARTDYGAILSTRIADTSQAIRDVNGTSGLIAPADWGTQIRTMKSASDYQNALEQMIEETASGAIASFTDGANNIPCPSVLCTINPVQDLHGQDYPYPSGGGKNKCEMTSNPIVLSSASNIGNQPCVLSSGTYTFSWTSSNSTAVEFTVYNGETRIALVSSTGAIQGRGSLTFTISQSSTHIRAYYNGATSISDIQIESGSTATPYAPYENICPITGHTACTVTNDKYYGGEIDFNQLVPTANRDFVNTRTETNQYINFLFRLNSSPYTVFYNKQVISVTGDFGFVAKATATGKAQLLHNGQRTQALFVNNIDVTNNHIYIGLLYFASSDITTVGGLVVNNIMLIDLTQMFGSTKADEIYAMEQATTGDGVAYVRSILPHDYYDYTASTVETAMEANGEVNPEVTTQFGTTVYGASLDVGTGVLTVTYGMIKLSDIPKTKYSTYEAGARFITTFFDTISNTKLMGNSLLLNAIGKTLQTPYPTSGSWLHFSVGSSKTSFLIDQADVGEGVQLNVSNVNSWLDSINAYAVYELATPTTTQLTPQEVKSLLGSNNIYHDCNGQVAVTYKANGNLYVAQH